MITREKFDEIFETVESYSAAFDGCRVTEGLIIVAKYSKKGLGAAEHDIVYSADVDELIEAGITEEEVIHLREMGWMVEYDCLAHFV